jgi:uncharacterized protein YPO0396
MHELQRIVLKDWGRLDVEDVDVRGAVAILGPTGSGKSTLVDAFQVIITGASKRFYELNESTGGHNERSIRDYCLGADDHISPGRPKREAAETLIALALRDRLSGEPMTIGLLLLADEAETRHTVKARFVAPGLSLSVRQLTEERPGGIRVFPNATRVMERLKELCPRIRLHATATAFVDDYLVSMRRRGASPDHRQVLRNFRKSIAFKPIDDPTKFVREHILEEDNIDVEALRGSIDRYRYLEQEVLRREDQLQEIAEARRRLQTWALHTIRDNALRYMAAHADRRRLDIVIDRIAAERAEIERNLEREFLMERRTLDQIRLLEEEVTRCKRLMAEVPGAQKVAGLEGELKGAEATRALARHAAARRVKGFQRLAGLASLKSRIPFVLHDALAAAEALSNLLNGRAVDALSAVDIELGDLERRSLRLLAAAASIEQQLDAVGEDIAKLRPKVEELEAVLREGGEGPLLSRPVRAFSALLERERIKPVPLPDLVEVVEPSWAMALEMLLGPNREALLVPPGQLNEAMGILYANRSELHSCRLVNTRRTDRWHSNLPAGSIAEIIETRSGDARAYIERQVGRFVRAETDRDLELIENGVTKRGKTTQGLSMRVYQDLTPILGRTAQAAAAAKARAELVGASAELQRLRTEQDLMRNALAAIRALAEEKGCLAEDVAALSAADAEIRSIRLSRASAQSPEAAAILQRQREIESDMQGYREDLNDEIRPRLEHLRKQISDQEVQARVRTSERDKVFEEETRREAAEQAEPLSRLMELVDCEDTVETARNRVAIAAEFLAGGVDSVARLADLTALGKRDSEQLPRFAEESARRGRHLWTEFVRQHVGGPPLTDPDEGAMLGWAKTRELQLERDELRQFRQAFEDARRKMEADLTEGLINRLSDKFQKARAQIKRLNRALEGRTFTGQTYVFDIRLNEGLRSIHALAEAIAGAPRRGLAILEDRDLDPRIRDGFAELERRLSDESLVGDLQDYRRFFDFEVRMKNARGEETTLSRRSQTGSGGQKQAPYYVAVGAAMASAYYPKSGEGEPDGLGLVVFDEAFNNLDAPNARALLGFFADLHLQVVVAAPDKVRAMFLESVDTIVSVNRRPDTQEPVIGVTYPSLMARKALADINPVNHGIDFYRPASQAAE